MNSSPCPSAHLSCLKKRKGLIKSADGKDIEVWDFNYKDEPAALSAWAAHFRSHYCLDKYIDALRGSKSRKDYLNEFKFPTETGGFGPSIRAGDFGEILIADFLQWVRGFWVPRVRWASKVIRNESPKGSDVVGFHVSNPEASSDQDIIAVFEVKTKFAATKENRLQDAINDSAKDHVRLGESLNFIRQKLFERGDSADIPIVDRFQNPTDQPYKKVF
ncbi:MAG: virulence associated protein, partial [Alphaproteobacteria bacterium]|nr:virulence associated protein [Alphaproteobacteria bacterium]